MDSNETNKLPVEAELEATLTNAVDETADSQTTNSEPEKQEEVAPKPKRPRKPKAEAPAQEVVAAVVEEVKAPAKKKAAPKAKKTVEPVAEDAVAAEPEEATITEVETETEASNQPVFSSKAEIIEHFKSIAETSASDIKEKVDALKQSFYKIHKQEVETARKLWQEAGNVVEEFVAAEDAMETDFKSLLNEWREKRAEHHAEQEKQRQTNLEKKLQIIDDIRKLTDSTEDIGRNFPEFRRLQMTWKETGSVPQEQVNTISKRIWNLKPFFVKPPKS